MNASHLRTKPGQAGFTLIELVITIVVIGIMVGIAAPSMTGWVRQTRVDGVVGELATDVARARMAAVRSSQPVTIGFLPGSGGYRIYRMNGTDTVWIKRAPLANAYPGLTLTASQQTVIFDSRGLLRSGSAQVEARDTQTGRAKTVRITATGRVQRAN